MSTKNDILRILESGRGTFISGNEIAGRLGVSKNAVWKAIRKLQSEGHMIEAVTNRGYMLSAGSDILSAEGISAYLASDLRIEVFDQIDSTNNVCLARANAGEASGYVAIAAEQTGGKGRRGRSFYSPGGTGLYISILLRPQGFTPGQAMSLTTIAAVSICEAIENICGRKASIKWVNDIYVNDLKVCGILTEASFDVESGTLDYAIVGAGINIYTPDGGFPPELNGIAGSVLGEYSVSGMDGERVNNVRNRLAAEILNRFMGRLSSGCNGHIEEYRKRCFVPGHQINVITAGSMPRRAFALGIDDDCGLIVRYEDGATETLTSGEISIRIQD